MDPKGGQIMVQGAQMKAHAKAKGCPGKPTLRHREAMEAQKNPKEGAKEQRIRH
jgi:hypothetical protein